MKHLLLCLVLWTTRIFAGDAPEVGGRELALSIRDSESLASWDIHNMIRRQIRPSLQIPVLRRDLTGNSRLNRRAGEPPVASSSRPKPSPSFSEDKLASETSYGQHDNTDSETESKSPRHPSNPVYQKKAAKEISKLKKNPKVIPSTISHMFSDSSSDSSRATSPDRTPRSKDSGGYSSSDAGRVQPQSDSGNEGYSPRKTGSRRGSFTRPRRSGGGGLGSRPADAVSTAFSSSLYRGSLAPPRGNQGSAGTGSRNPFGRPPSPALAGPSAAAPRSKSTPPDRPSMRSTQSNRRRGGNR